MNNIGRIYFLVASVVGLEGQSIDPKNIQTREMGDDCTCFSSPLFFAESGYKVKYV